MEVSVAQLCPTLSRQSPLSMGFSRQDYWSELPFPFPGDLRNPGIKLRSPALQADSLSHAEPPGNPPWCCLAVVVQLSFSLTVFDPVDRSTAGFPDPHFLSECAHTHVHSVSDAIQPSSATLFSFCLRSFPGSGSFPMSHLYIFILK